MNQISFQITGRCNMNCGFCWDAVSYQKESCIEDIKRVIRRFTKQGLKKIHITGGEPLVYENLKEVLEYMKEEKLEVSLSTNGLFLLQQKEILELIDEVTLPLDGVYAKTFIEMGREKNQLANTIKNACMIKESFPQIKLKISTVLTRQNVKELQTLITVVSQLPIDEWEVYQFLPHGNGKRNIQRFLLDDREFEGIVKILQATQISERITPISAQEKIGTEWILTPALYLIKRKEENPRFYGKVDELSDQSIKEILQAPIQYVK